MTNRAAGPRAAGTRAYLTFRAGTERLGVPLDRVQGAARPRHLTPLPGSPAEYAGLALVRGEPVGVLDVAAALGLASPSTVGRRPVLLLLEGDSRALLVDRIDAIDEIAPERISPPPPGARRLSGLVPDGDRFLALIDLDALLSGGRA